MPHRSLPSTPELTRLPKRERILHGAMQVFLDSGYAGASMDRVAAAAGVAKNTIYSHFQDKEGLFAALIEWIAEQRLQTTFSQAMLSGEPAQVLPHLARTFLETVASDREYIDFLRLMIAESGRFPELAQLFVRYLPQQALAIVSDYLRSRPELDLPNSEAAARIFLYSLVGFVLTQQVLHGSTIIPLASEDLIDTLVKLLVSKQQV